MTVYFATLKVFGFEKSNAEALAGLIYMLAVGILGYIWKLKNGRTYSLLDGDGNKKLIHYAFGAAIVLVGIMLLASIKFIVSIGSWWPLVLILLVPLGLFAQTLHFTILVMAGGLFCRK